jgi:hypothetical protein
MVDIKLETVRCDYCDTIQTDKKCIVCGKDICGEHRSKVEGRMFIGYKKDTKWHISATVFICSLEPECNPNCFQNKEKIVEELSTLLLVEANKHKADMERTNLELLEQSDCNL